MRNDSLPYKENRPSVDFVATIIALKMSIVKRDVNTNKAAKLIIYL
jgi:hypothetical protein